MNKNSNLKLRPHVIHKKKSGFTLVELIVVIGIISILAIALTPKLSGYIKEAKKVTVLTQIKNVVTAYEAVNAKTTANLPTNQNINNFISTYGGDLITTDDVKNIDSSKITINDCFNALDTDNYTFTLDANNIFSEQPKKN